jgi:AraC-like DNA-binding protein/N-acetylglutamate synthase-like GNAT family acetyltransferase
MDYWKYLEQAVGWIEKNLTNELGLSRIASAVGCSDYHFARIFKKHTSHSVIDYVRKRRLVHSVQRLYGESRISDIAAEFRYETPSGFSRAFRKYYGYSPSQYREIICAARESNGDREMRIGTVENESVLRRVYDFGDYILNYTHLDEFLYSWGFWSEQHSLNPQFLLYAAEAEIVCGAVWGWVGDNNNVTAGLVAVAEGYRRQGIGKRLITELASRVKEHGHPIIALGARQEAEGFYLSCGFTPTLFLQSKKHSLAELRAVNRSYDELWGVEADSGGWAKLMLKTPVIDEELKRRYDQLFEDCVPQTVFLMFL